MQHQPLKVVAIIHLVLVALSGAVANNHLDSTTIANIWALRSNYPDSALKQCNSLLLSTLESEDEADKATVHSIRGVVLKNLGRYDLAFQDYQEAVKWYKRKKDTAQLAQLYNRIAVIHQKKGNYEEATTHLFRSLKLYDNYPNLAHEKIDVYSNLAVVFSLKGQYQQAIDFYERGMELCQSLNDNKRSAVLMYNKAIAFYHLEQYEQAARLLIQCLEIEKQASNDRQIARINNSLGVLEETQENWGAAKKYYLKGIQISRKMNNLEDLSYGYANLGDLSASQERYVAAHDYYTQSMQLAVQLKHQDLLLLGYENLAAINQKMGRYSEAAKLLEKRIALLEVQFQESSDRNIQELREQFEAREREDRIRLLKKDLSIQEVQLENEKLIGSRKNWMVLGLLSLLVIGGLATIGWRKKWKKDQIIQTQQAAIKRQELLDRIKEKEVESVSLALEAQKNERHRIAEELHDRLGGLVGTLKLYVNSIQDKVRGSDAIAVTEELDRVESLVETTGSEIRNIAHAMAFNVLAENGLLDALQNMCSLVRDSGAIAVEWNTFGMEGELDSQLEVQLFRSAHELINNVLKHAQATLISVQFTGYENEVNLIVEDNGVGFNSADLKNVKGMGLRNLSERLQGMEGELILDTSLGRGTVVVINVPRQSTILKYNEE